MRVIRVLNLKRLRLQPLRAVLGIVAIAAGTSLFVGVLIDRNSLDQSFEEFVAQRAGNARLEVHGPGGPAGLDASVLPKIAAVDGVAAAAPIIQVVTIAETAGGDERFVAAFGVDCTIEAVMGSFGCEDSILSLQNAFATSTRLAASLGPDGVVRTDAGRLHMVNSFPIEMLDELNQGNVVITSIAEAQRLFGHAGALTSILVVPEEGASLTRLRADLQDAAGEHNLVSEPGTIGGADFAAMLVTLLLFMSVFGLAVGAQLVHNTMALSLEERRRDLAVVGAIGARPRTILIGTLVEAALLGAVGGLVGVGGGILLARPLVQGMSNTLDEMTGLTISVHVSTTAIVAGIVLGILTGVAAAIGPARRASRMDVAAELHGQARNDETARAGRGRRAIAYSALAVVGMAMAWIGQRDGAIEPWQPLVAFGGFGLTAIISFRAAQHGSAPLFALVGRLPFLRNGTARMALANLGGEPKRAGVMVGALAVAVGVGVVLGNTNGSIVAGSGEAAESITSDGVFVSTLAANNMLGVEAKPSEEVVAALRAMDGVVEVQEEHGFCGEHPAIGPFCVSSEYGVHDAFPIHRGRQSMGEVFRHGEVLIGGALARSRGLAPGDTFEVPGRTGMHTLTVGAVWSDPENGGLAITVPPESFGALYGADRPSSSLIVVPEPGITNDDLAARIEAAAIDPDLRALTEDGLREDFERSIGGFVTPFIALQRGMFVVGLIAVTSTLLLVGVQRRREHGLLLAVGMAPAGLGRMVLAEAGLVGVVASIVGTVAGIGTYIAMMWVSPLFTGLTAPFRFDLTMPFLYGGIGLAFVLLGASLPALRTARLDPAVALRYE